MNDIISEEEMASPKNEYDNISLKMGIVSLLMMPLAFYFFYDRVFLLGYAFLFGSPILALFGLIFLKNYKKDFIFFNASQQKKFKISKIICTVSFCIGLLAICLLVLLFFAVSTLH